MFRSTVSVTLSPDVVTLVDTPGADPNVSSEERGISESIARHLREMSVASCPIVSVIIGEGGSGGALALAIADEVLINENGVYSVISPEGCASILWRSAEYSKQAAAALRLTARDLEELGVIDQIIEERIGFIFV